MTTAAVIGCGDVSIVHLEAIEKLADSQLVAVCDTDPGTAAAVASTRKVPGFTDHREMLATARPEVVHISTPHHQHAQLAIDCLAAGVHVVLEKPVAHTVAEAERVVAAAAGSPKVKIGVCFQNRYNAAIQAASALIRSGELGAVAGGAATVLWHRTPAYYTKRPWRGERALSGGGVMINQAIHTLDLMQWLLGDVTRVAGQVGTNELDGVIDVEDTAQLVLHHGEDRRSVLFATTTHVTDSPVGIEIVAENATLRIRGDLTISWADGRVETVSERRASSGGRSYWGVSHELLIDDFYGKLGSPEPFWISPAEGLKVSRILHELYSGERRQP
ncbi:MAG: putative lipopolysaccharide biosynthesis protein [uncultured Friedmanniella sp.]|uniref:Putative lipopolysaccharide biosynthesis protein n=1 Tax=uncultured Friedmanniella sp. TaxID=335381 RepID=A0A6J4LH02_9ACTN|nr:Gfo/Idh/MocA family oxidoreductase [uncultured Friedmanniella sp.]CAA9333483.1 MAG: putative lipopolysaccharide biosynthesis protein [uncultured Friedmanniella sp.]